MPRHFQAENVVFWVVLLKKTKKWVLNLLFVALLKERMRLVFFVTVVGDGLTKRTALDKE